MGVDQYVGGSNMYSVQLNPGEHITEVEARTAHDSITNLKFTTSESRCVGPFGSLEGKEVDLMETVRQYRREGVFYDAHTYHTHICEVEGPHDSIPLDTILVGVTGIEVEDEGVVVIKNVRFVFRLWLPKNSQSPSRLCTSQS